MKNQTSSSASKNLTGIMGLRVVGDTLTAQKIHVDQDFEQCPIAHAAGIPLFVKRLFNAPRKQHPNHIIVRMMSEPSIGLARRDWQYGGCLEPAPPVLVARSDSIEFTTNDWYVLDEFEMLMLDDGPRKVTREDFIRFVKANYRQNQSNIVLEALYPKGRSCRIEGLVNKTQLNGKIGMINGDYQNGRVGVKVEGLAENLGIRPKNFRILEAKLT